MNSRAIEHCSTSDLLHIYLFSYSFSALMMHINSVKAGPFALWLVLYPSVQFSSVQSFSCDWLFVTLWTAAHHATLSMTNSWSLLKLMSIKSVMPSNHLILCYSLQLPPSIFVSIRVFSNESVLPIRWPKYWSFSFNISLSMNIPDWFLLGWTGWISLQSKGLSRVFSNTTVQKHQFFNAQLSL